MKKVLLLVLFFVFSFSFVSPNSADATYVRGYYRSNGTYVQPYHRTSPNSTYRDNYSYKGNYNPYTGKIGTKTYRSYKYKY